MALASTTEVEYHLEFAADASIIPRREFAIRQQEVIEVRRMLTGLVKHIRISTVAAPAAGRHCEAR